MRSPERPCRISELPGRRRLGLSGTAKGPTGSVARAAWQAIVQQPVVCFPSPWLSEHGSPLYFTVSACFDETAVTTPLRSTGLTSSFDAATAECPPPEP